MRVVRLNASLFRVGAFERAQYAQHGLEVIEAEAADPEELIRVLAGCDGLFAISVSLPAKVIASLDRCRVISRMGTGTDKIDVALATRMGIVVTNVPYFCIEEQADHAMAMMLGLSRQLPAMSAAMRAGLYNPAQAATRSNRRISQQTLGLVGFGRSAKHMARRARGFGMRVLATRRRAVDDPDAAAIGVEMVDFDTVLAQSDWVSLHLPLMAETYHLIDGAAIARMKPGACLINTSRGALVDEAALLAALRSGHLRGAGLDTFESIDVFAGTLTPSHNPLFEMQNVIATPHVAAGSVESGQDVNSGAVENLADVLAGRWPLAEHIVNAEVVPRVALRAR
jgi:D-3-phosphoglycerate dehydrogenase